MGKIDVQNVDLSYETNNQSYAALRNVSFFVDDGDFVSIIGPSGCGKTTLLNLLIGLIKPTCGQILLNGCPLQGTGKERSAVFQDYSLFPWMTVMKNITFAMRQVKSQKQKELEAVALGYLKAVGLEDFRDKFPAELSGGMRQRVAIVRALATEPEILLLDEPFGAIDPKNRRDLHGILLDLWSMEGKKCTIIFVTHDIDEAMLLSDRIIVLSASPGTVREEINIPFKRPRNLESIAFDSAYMEIRNRILPLFHENSGLIAQRKDT